MAMCIYKRLTLLNIKLPKKLFTRKSAFMFVREILISENNICNIKTSFYITSVKNLNVEY